MSKLKKLTEDKYTLSDIFVKHHEFWLCVPLFIYLLTPIVHMITYAFLFSEEFNEAEMIHFMETGEYAGDYYSPIIHLAFLLGAILAVIAVLAHLVYAKQNKIKKSSDNIPALFFLAYVILIIVSTIANKTDVSLIMGYTARSEGTLSIIAYFLIYYLCGSLIKNEKIKYSIIFLFLITGTVIGILSIVNKYVTDISVIGDETLSGIFYHFNFYAYYLAISIMLCASVTVLNDKLVIRIIASLIMCLDTFVLAVNDSMGGFLACVVAFAFLVIAASVHKHKFSWLSVIMFAVFILIIFITGFFTPSFLSELGKLGKDVGDIVTNSANAGSAGTSRWTLWTHTAQYIKEKPWIGWGFEGTAERLGTETHADKAHNEYLENMAYYGVPAGVIYVVGLISIYIKALKKRHNVDAATICCLTAALAYIASAFVGNSFIFISPFFFIFLGLANNTQLKKVNENKENESESADGYEEINETEEIAVTE